MPQTMEIVRARIKPGHEDAMLAERPAFVAAVRSRFPGLVDASLVKLDEDVWLDVVRWSSREQAEAAAAQFAEIPECARMQEHIAEVLAFEHGTIAA